MSSHMLVALGIVLILLVSSNGYWWRRLTATEAALTTSLDREKRITEQRRVERSRQGGQETESETEYSTGADAEVTLQRAAERADCPPPELPERIETLHERIRKKQNETERLRQSWAVSWWDALDRDPPVESRPRVISCQFEHAMTDDIQKFAEISREKPQTIAVFVAKAAGAATVTVSDDLVGEFSAAELLEDLCERAGGDGGGSQQFATGGGFDAGELGAAVERLTSDIQAKVEEGEMQD